VIATRASAKRFLIGVGVATLVACSMFYFKAVTVKLLPFDNKSEVQLVAICPRARRWSRPRASLNRPAPSPARSPK
jgi:hypothetical protein